MATFKTTDAIEESAISPGGVLNSCYYVNTFAELPGSPITGQAYYVLTATGTYAADDRKNPGFYYWDGTDWIYAGDNTREASDAQYDNGTSGLTATNVQDAIDEVAAGGTAPVDSVNGQTGVVVLDTDDIAEGAANFYYTEARVSANASVVANTAKVSNATHTGDVTGSTALTIANDAVTFAKMQNITTDRLLGRGTAGSGDTEEITLGTNLSLTGTTLNAVGGTAPVDSVNGQTGVVVLDTDDITEGATNLYYTEVRVAANSAVTANTAKVTNATHTGDVTGATALTIAANAVTTTKIINDAVTFAKIQNATANTFLARAAATSGDVSAVGLSASELAGRGSTGNVASITLGTNLSMSGTTLNAASSAAPVDSVNGQTGVVVLDTDDISEGATNLYYTEVRVSANASVVANTAKVSNATHTGDVTGSTALTIATSAVTSAKINTSAVTTTKIADANVTLAKIQNVNANSILTRAAGTSGVLGQTAIAASQLFGRGSTGNLTALSLGAALEMTPSSLQIKSLGIAGTQIQADAITTTKIIDDAVTYAKMQNVNANSFMARAASTSGDMSAVALTASQLAGRGATGDVAAITLGTNLSMSGTTLNASGGAAPVDSVNGQTGVVVLDADDIAEGATNLYYTEARVTSNASVVANSAKVTNATHTGDVTGSGALTIANDAVTFGKFQNVAANSVPARSAGTSGDLSEVSLSSSQLLGRGQLGNVTSITLGTNLAMVGDILNASGAGGASDLDGLSDVTITTPATDQFLQYNGSQWVNTAIDTDDISEGSTNLYYTEARVSANASVVANSAKVSNATHTGDVTGSTALTIANNAVTFAKFQDITTARLLGRATAGTGDTEEIILGTNLSFTGTTLNAASGGIANVVDDTTPQLGGDLDVNGNDIVSVSNGDINIAPNGTGDVVIGNPGTSTASFDSSGNMIFAGGALYQVPTNTFAFQSSAATSAGLSFSSGSAALGGNHFNFTNQTGATIFKVSLNNHLDLIEIASAPGTPAAGYNRLYTIDNGGTAELWFIGNDGVSTQIV